MPAVSVVGRGTGEREVEQDEVGLLAWPHLDDAQVVGLHVTVRDTDLLQVADRFEQVLAPAAQEVGAHRTLGPQVAGERPLTGEGQHQHLAAAQGRAARRARRRSPGGGS